MWRFLAFLATLIAACCAHQLAGQDAGEAVLAALGALLLALSEIERRLAAILKKLHAKRTDGACEIIGPVSQAQKIQEEQ